MGVDLVRLMKVLETIVADRYGVVVIYRGKLQCGYNATTKDDALQGINAETV